jgi:ABC-type antimicrobial peptide transport system permease subunit
MILALFGVAVGSVLALAITRLLASFLHGVSSFDPWTFVIAMLLLSFVTLLARWLPARRATHINPVQALRHA